VLVPVFLYLQFSSAHRDSQELLLNSVRDEGRVISKSLLPLLETADRGSLPELGHHLARFAGEVTTIKVLLAPADAGAGSDGFYYVASWNAKPWRARACSIASLRIAAAKCRSR